MRAANRDRIRVTVGSECRRYRIGKRAAVRRLPRRRCIPVAGRHGTEKVARDRGIRFCQRPIGERRNARYRRGICCGINAAARLREYTAAVFLNDEITFVRRSRHVDRVGRIVECEIRRNAAGRGQRPVAGKRLCRRRDIRVRSLNRQNRKVRRECSRSRVYINR